MNKYSYITLLTDDSYIYGVILLQQSLKEVNSQYPLEVLVTPNVSKPILTILDQLQLSYIIIEPIKDDKIFEYNKKTNPNMARIWSLCLSKLKIFNLTQFDKLVFLDADIMIMKNIDHLFEYPHLTSALDGEYFNLWPDWDHFNSGILVIKPDQKEYDNLLNFISNQALNEEWKEGECIADQEILNHYYSNWVNTPELHLNKYYDIFAPYIQEEQINDIDENCYFIHYVGRKPWRAFQKNASETYTEKYYTIAHEMIQKIVNSLDWDQAKDQLKLAVYGICKDEIDNVKKYVECFSKADYLCILDTGSTDGTWEYLQEAKKTYPNLIIDQKIVSPWRYDKARNISLTLVPKDTVMYFMVDLDEIIKEDNWAHLIKASWNPLFVRGTYVYNRFVDIETDKPIHTFNEYRIHNYLWHYEGIVHEQLINISGQRDMVYDECINVPIVVWHYPKIKDKSIYIQLCEEELEENPTNWVMQLQLAIEYEVNKVYDKAIERYKYIIISDNTLSNPEIGRCYASLGRLLTITNRKHDIDVFNLGIINCPNYGDNYFLAAEYYYNQKKFKKAFKLCKKGLENTQENYWCTLIKKDGHYPYLLMGLCQLYLKNYMKALGYLTIAKEKNNTDEVANVYTMALNEIMNRR